MTDLRCYGSIINLEGESSVQLGIDLLGWRHTTEMVRCFELEINHKPLPQETPKDYAQMASTFLLYILGVYLFPNGGQTMSLRWLALFLDFEDAQRANSVVGLCISWWGLKSSLRSVLSSFPFVASYPHVSCAFANYVLISFVLQLSSISLQTIILHTVILHTIILQTVILLGLVLLNSIV